MKNNITALNNEPLAKISNPGSVKLQTQKCKLQIVVCVGGKIIAKSRSKEHKTSVQTSLLPSTFLPKTCFLPNQQILQEIQSCYIANTSLSTSFQCYCTADRINYCRCIFQLIFGTYYTVNEQCREKSWFTNVFKMNNFWVFPMDINVQQGCALAEPGGSLRATFAPGRLENLRFFIQIICWAP